MNSRVDKRKVVHLGIQNFCYHIIIFTGSTIIIVDMIIIICYNILHPNQTELLVTESTWQLRWNNHIEKRFNNSPFLFFFLSLREICGMSEVFLLLSIICFVILCIFLNWIFRSDKVVVNYKTLSHIKNGYLLCVSILEKCCIKQRYNMILVILGSSYRLVSVSLKVDGRS